MCITTQITSTSLQLQTHVWNVTLCMSPKMEKQSWQETVVDKYQLMSKASLLQTAPSPPQFEQDKQELTSGHMLWLNYGWEGWIYWSEMTSHATGSRQSYIALFAGNISLPISLSCFHYQTPLGKTHTSAIPKSKIHSVAQGQLSSCGTCCGWNCYAGWCGHAAGGEGFCWIALKINVRKTRSSLS